jgi:F0F1-type ATP synthase membrane subunit b/b'
MTNYREGFNLKKITFVLVILIVLSMSLTACSGISSEQYEEVSTQLSDAKTANNDLQTQLTDLQEQYETLNVEYEEIKVEKDALEAIIAPYKALTEAEATLKAKETQAKLDKIAAEDAKKAAKEKAAKEAEEKKGYNTGITYSQLARTPDDYYDKKVKFSGEVLQVVEGDTTVQLRLAVDNDYDQIIFTEYDKSIVKSRVLEDDEITIYGTSYGLFSYESTGSGTITIPSVYIDKIDQ